MKSHMEAYTDFFCELCLQDYEICANFSEEVRSVAIILCSRRCLNLAPLCNVKIFLLKLCDEKEISKCFTFLWSYYRKNFPSKVSLVEERESNSRSATPISVAR
eukprot:TRINITY_DN2240_c0_g1_i1.p1 TRINITY_DN2240_c0_g1~~TRINITY_DN2240_c0_g1_i1.p1  ORF type:complete len:104 (-),score=6.59 TRINITY_DN2240_c0_g1_i1:351-662(-)